jgi:hypothetical protein
VLRGWELDHNLDRHKREPESEGDVVVASMPTSTQLPHMHPTQPRYNNPRPALFGGRLSLEAGHGAEMIGLPKTRSGTLYLSNEIG